MIVLLNRLIGLFQAIPHDLIAILARIGIGTVFLRSGLLKVEGWANGNTVALFRDEYRLPFVPPELAAPMAMAAELSMSCLIIAGFFSRFAALALLVMTLVIEIFVYPNAFDTHAVWAVSLIYLIKHGPGVVSIDHFLEQQVLGVSKA